MQIKPASEHVGAEITDVNLADSLSKGTFETIDDAYNRYSLLIFRDQQLSPEQQIAFARGLDLTSESLNRSRPYRLTCALRAAKSASLRSVIAPILLSR